LTPLAPVQSEFARFARFRGHFQFGVLGTEDDDEDDDEDDGGVSVIPESFGINRFQGIRAHHLTDKAAAWTVAAAWRKDDPNPLIQRFLALLKTELVSHSA
jgi:hypothetical protein